MKSVEDESVSVPIATLSQLNLKHLTCSIGQTDNTSSDLNEFENAPIAPALTFSINKLASPSAPTPDSEIIQRLESFRVKYEQMSADIQVASKLIATSSQCAENQLRTATLLHYRRKLHNIHQAMINVDSAILSIQQRLNKIRKGLPARKHSLVETGPFYFKCIYHGGVRYRDYPSVNAKVVSDDDIVVNNQVVEVAERVFIAAEHSVFLHCKGKGWIFENKKEIICFERVAPPSLS